MAVPLLDLRKQYQSIKKEVDTAVEQVLASGNYILGQNVAALEEEVAAFCGTKYGIGVASGTDALLLSLMAAGVEPGDEIITTPYTFFATAEVVSWLGATPVFVDIDPKTYNIDLKKIEEKITCRTKAIIPVHLFGQIADMDGIMALAQKHKLAVIEDACQAMGARFRGIRAGAIGHAGCFSFFPSKNLSGYGDGGMIVTNDVEMVGMVRTLRVHGSRKKYFHDLLGFNSRLDEIQAAIIRVKLRYLDRWNSLRREKAAVYGDLLSQAGFSPPYVDSRNQHIYHLYVIRSSMRDELKRRLACQNIGCGIYYPLPLHLQPVYMHLGYQVGDLPEAEKASQETIALPMFPELTTDQIKEVVAGLGQETV